MEVSQQYSQYIHFSHNLGLLCFLLCLFFGFRSVLFQSGIVLPNYTFDLVGSVSISNCGEAGEVLTAPNLRVLFATPILMSFQEFYCTEVADQLS